MPQSAMKDFKNEPFTDFTKGVNATAMREALMRCRQQLGSHHPLWIDGEDEDGSKRIASVNPSRLSEVVGTVASASSKQALKAIESAHKTFETWKRVPWAERSALLTRTATLLRKRKHDFSALLVLEVGKSWAEADGDTAEAIDFLEFYARLALEMAQPRALIPVKGEANRLEYIPLGVTTVIPPWNFPLAILCGMTAAAIVCGNTVVLKPSSDAPVVAAAFVKLLREAGLPGGVVNFCPGSGSEIGDSLVDHPLVRLISFTGSKDIGLRIVERAGKTHKGQQWIKRVVAEMGGKDAILVDKDCDLDAAVSGTVASAFGFSGQKCSACSRVIVHADRHKEFTAKLVEAVQSRVTVGPVEDNRHFMGPVVSQGAHRTIMAYIEAGRKEGKLLTGGKAGNPEGFFIEPTVFDAVKPKARIACEEIFGPVLAVMKCADFEEGLNIVNATDFGLTGAVYSTDKEHLAMAERDFHVGNLYLNRKCTGALVGAHPFGGFNMSGTDSKAGGYDYLQLFTQAKMISAKI
ncbi:MAG: L-glutamate gamma-semialdehyde dehydrogenase [Planctomycetota bacterium]